MIIKIWPFCSITIARYNVRHAITTKWHEIINSRRVKQGKPFKDKNLRYAARNKCPCGAGLAYVRGLPYSKAFGRDFNYWDCSDILTGRASKDVEHTAQLPFMCYEIKSEDQPSAYGATTRPKGKGSK